MPAIKTTNLTKTFDKLKAVNNISFQVGEGEIFGFLGPNGAGKTTTILMLISLVSPTSGKIQINGFDALTQQKEVRHSIGYVSQDLALDEYLTGRENLEFQTRFYHLPKDLAEKRINEVLDLVSLIERQNDLVVTYSGGMRKRLDLACGLLHTPKILFLDEPTLGLDVQTRRKIWEHIKQLRKEHNMTIFLTTHYLEEADYLCDRVAIIDFGEIKAIDSPKNLKKELGGEVLTLEFFENRNFDDIIKELNSLDFVKEVSQSNNSLLVIVSDGEKSMPKVLTMINKLGLTVSSISLKKPSLDDVFISYTGRHIRDEVSNKEQLRREQARFRRIRA